MQSIYSRYRYKLWNIIRWHFFTSIDILLYHLYDNLPNYRINSACPQAECWARFAAFRGTLNEKTKRGTFYVRARIDFDLWPKPEWVMLTLTQEAVADDNLVMKNLYMKFDEPVSKRSGFMTEVKVLLWPWHLSKQPRSRPNTPPSHGE